MTNGTMSSRQDESAAVTYDELIMAIEHRGLELYYQPVVDLRSERLQGFEALVRLSHPTLGVIPAADFVPLAENCGLIRALDHWVLSTACEQLAVWQAKELVGPDFDLAINVSGSEADGSTLGSRLQRASAATGANPAGLVVEITESQQGEPHASARSVAALHDLGVRVALDDFGMSFATFSRLRSLDFDIVKIDRRLTSVISTKLGQGFLRLVVDMCHEKGSTIVAEGIETGQQARLATELGCDLGQGYLWSHALPAPEAERLLVAGAPRRRTESSVVLEEPDDARRVLELEDVEVQVHTIDALVSKVTWSESTSATLRGTVTAGSGRPCPLRTPSRFERFKSEARHHASSSLGRSPRARASLTRRGRRRARPAAVEPVTHPERAQYLTPLRSLWGSVAGVLKISVPHADKTRTMMGES